jgi:hypothetical protein
VCPSEQTADVDKYTVTASFLLIGVHGESQMLRSVTELEKYTIGATDGTIGSIKDCYFDDEAWVVRYFVVKTGAWLVGREVLISPLSVRDSDTEGRVLQRVHQQRSSQEKPEHRHSETRVSAARDEYSAYYGYPYYWGGAGLWGEARIPVPC